MTPDPTPPQASAAPARTGGSNLPRRHFLAGLGLGAAGAFVAGLPAVAGPFESAEFERLVPADKKLAPDWIRSLFARGEPTVYRGAELEHIGMPVGGLCAGQLYLGGDGKLWLWDVFNQPPPPDFGSGAGPFYAHPLPPKSPISQGFALRIRTQDRTEVRPLDRAGFKEITFRGQYPMGFVEYQDPAAPVTVGLEAFSPFIPLDIDNSSLPATVMQFTVRNVSRETVSVEVAGWLENAVCLGGGAGDGQRRNRIRRERGLLMLHCTAEAAPPATHRQQRPDIVFDDFESPSYAGWTATGTAFGDGPVEQARMPAYQGDVGAHGKRLVNSHNTRHGEDVVAGDAHVGTLTSRPFRIERNYITFLIGGGAHPGQTCINLRIAGRVVASATGANDNRLRPHSFDVRQWGGQSAQLEIVDAATGPWGNIGIDDIVFSDRPRQPGGPLEARADNGSMALALLGGGRGRACADLPAGPLPAVVFPALAGPGAATATAPFGQRLCGALGRGWRLRPGTEATATFLVTWYFPGLRREGLQQITGIEKLHRFYKNRFDSAAGVARYVGGHFRSLAAQTRRWHATWYGGTLPHWLLERTLLNISILATATCYRFDNGRFYGWEGTYCCAGTCTHVWQYAQAVGRLFPALERSVRETVDYGLAYHPETGAMDYRAEADRRVAIDGQAGTILRVYREHQMSVDAAFLRRNWAKVRKSIEYLMGQEGGADGLLEGEQYNTLDASWYGEIPWLSSLYLAALRAGEAMAREMADGAFAERCATIAARGRELLVAHLFNGEYFIQRLNPRHREAINTNLGCEIDQVYGQSWAFQVGLERVVPEKESRSALQALWRYNFTPDVGVYRRNFQIIPGGRWYAMPGEGGVLMCTWPRGGAATAAGRGNPGFVAYFNECMTGFEYQVAGHMLWEGLVEEGLAITRMIHDRYHAAKRNPWNEVECSNHYARAMASYGVYVAACGFEYHGPRGHLGFAPRLVPERFKAAFTAAEGWGTFTQERTGASQRAAIDLAWGRLRLASLALAVNGPVAVTSVKVAAAGRAVAASLTVRGNRAEVALAAPVILEAGQQLTLELA